MMPEEIRVKVRLLQSKVIRGSVWFQSDVVEVPLDQAREMVNARQAEEVTPLPPLLLPAETELNELDETEEEE